jgi:FKBP-type peptidyl-prolyl cis-trans isomerase SlpA
MPYVASRNKAVTTINQTSTVELFFALRLENGNEIDSCFGGEPARFTMGDGSLLPGFEKCLLGLGAGDEQTFLLPPAQAFGELNPDSVHQVERARFSRQLAKDVKLTPGLIVSFDGAGKQPMPGIVREVSDTLVTVDFNHPLAGRSIEFKVHIVSVDNPA